MWQIVVKYLLHGLYSSHCQVILSEASKRSILIVLTIFSASKEVYKEKVVSSGIFMSPASLSVGTRVIVPFWFHQMIMSLEPSILWMGMTHYINGAETAELNGGHMVDKVEISPYYELHSVYTWTM